MAAGIIETAIAQVAVGFRRVKEENGYSTTVRYVGRHLIAPDTLDKHQVPAVFVIRQPGATSEIQQSDGEVYRQIVPLKIIGYLAGTGQNPDDQGLATAAERFLADLKKLVIAEQKKAQHFDTPVVKWVQIVGDSNDAGWDTESAVVTLDLLVETAWHGVNP